MKKIKVVVTGASGRMGQTIIKKVLGDKNLKLIGALEVSGHKNIGQDLGKILKTKKMNEKSHQKSKGVRILTKLNYNSFFQSNFTHKLIQTCCMYVPHSCYNVT